MPEPQLLVTKFTIPPLRSQLQAYLTLALQLLEYLATWIFVEIGSRGTYDRSAYENRERDGYRCSSAGLAPDSGASHRGNHRARLYCHSFCQHSCLRDAAPAGLSRFCSCLNAQHTLQAFSASLREEVDLTRLSEHIVAVVQETVQPASVSLWLLPSGRKALQLLPDAPERPAESIR
jgi:hypothetical protein